MMWVSNCNYSIKRLSDTTQAFWCLKYISVFPGSEKNSMTYVYYFFCKDFSICKDDVSNTCTFILLPSMAMIYYVTFTIAFQHLCVCHDTQSSSNYEK